MARADIHLDERLRHLGAAYYDSLHGRASRSDVTRAFEAVEEHLKAQQRRAPGGVTAPIGVRRGERGQRAARAIRHVPRVRDIMTKKVVTVDRLTPYSEIVRLLTEHRISGVSVLTMGRHVAGVVSEADLVAAEDTDARQARIAAEARTGRHLSRGRPRRRNLTAAADDLAGHHHQPGRDDPPGGPRDAPHHVRRLPSSTMAASWWASSAAVTC